MLLLGAGCLSGLGLVPMSHGSDVAFLAVVGRP